MAEKRELWAYLDGDGEMTEIGVKHLIAIVTLVVFQAFPTLAGTFSCSDPPDKKAKLGVASGNSVQITQDKSNKECSFSVNGAPVGSPDQRLVLDGFNQFSRDFTITRNLDNRNVQGLAYALLASAPVTEVPDSVISILRKNAPGLSSCIKDFYRGRNPRFSEGGLSCRAWQPTDIPRNTSPSDRSRLMAAALDKFGVVVFVRTIEISLDWGDRFRSRLFVPITRRGRPPFQIR